MGRSVSKEGGSRSPAASTPAHRGWVGASSTAAGAHSAVDSLASAVALGSTSSWTRAVREAAAGRAERTLDDGTGGGAPSAAASPSRPAWRSETPTQSTKRKRDAEASSLVATQKAAPAERARLVCHLPRLRLGPHHRHALQKARAPHRVCNRRWCGPVRSGGGGGGFAFSPGSAVPPPVAERVQKARRGRGTGAEGGCAGCDEARGKQLRCPPGEPHSQREVVHTRDATTAAHSCRRVGCYRVASGASTSLHIGRGCGVVPQCGGV